MSSGGLWGKGQAAFKGFMGSLFGTASSSHGKHYVGEVGDLQDGQMKEANLEMEGKSYKVLLSRVRGQYYATGHLCTHYKARMVTGVLTEEGRLVCPWHAACFNVASGDIEESPAVEALKKYPVIIENDKVYVMASFADFETTGGVASCAKVSELSDKRTFVIIGGGAAGAMAAESIRSAGFLGKVVVLSKEPHLPIDRIKLSKFLDLKADSILLHQPHYLERIKVEYRLGREATALDVEGRQVKLDDGSSIGYDKLLIATGGEPRRLPLPGADLKNIHVIRHLDSNAAILQAVQEMGKPKVVIIGASFIGMEAASMMAKVSSSVTVVALESVPLERVLGAKVGRVFQRLHEKNGIKFKLNASLKGFLPTDGGDASVRAVELGDGSIIDADLIILGVGIKLSTDFVKGTLPLLPDGGIPVDSHLRVQDCADIFAAGDIATFPFDPTNSSIRVEHWDVASQQGRIAGHNMVKEDSDRKKYNSVPFFFTIQFGRSVRYSGSTAEGYEEVHIEGDIEGEPPSFAAYYISKHKFQHRLMSIFVCVEGERVLAVATMGKDPLAVYCSELLRRGKMLSASKVKSGESPLSIPI